LSLTGFPAGMGGKPGIKGRVFHPPAVALVFPRQITLRILAPKIASSSRSTLAFPLDRPPPSAPSPSPSASPSSPSPSSSLLLSESSAGNCCARRAGSVMKGSGRMAEGNADGNAEGWGNTADAGNPPGVGAAEDEAEAVAVLLALLLAALLLPPMLLLVPMLRPIGACAIAPAGSSASSPASARSPSASACSSAAVASAPAPTSPSIRATPAASPPTISASTSAALRCRRPAKRGIGPENSGGRRELRSNQLRRLLALRLARASSARRLARRHLAPFAVVHCCQR
ncbi:unnamed protein product, partial [Closterium sp. Naga37s-1]